MASAQTSTSSNKAETTYFIGNSEAVTKLHAGRNADNSIAYLLPRLERLAEQDPSFTFLDVGCGPGSITLDLAGQFPKASFVGIDGSAQVIEQAEKASRATGGKSNCTFKVGDVMKLQEQGLTGFDVVHVHQVFQHVPDAEAALASMKAAAKPNGGIVAVREADWGMFAWYPENRGLELNRELWINTAKRQGNDPHVAKRLHVLAYKLGWSPANVQFQYDGLWFFDRPERREPVAGAMIGRYDEEGSFAERLREAGHKEIEVKLQVMREGWRDWAQMSEAWCVMPCCSIVCVNNLA